MPFSPPVKKLYDRIHAFQTLIKIKNGSKPKTNIRRAYRTARRCGITTPHSRSIEDCIAGIEEANRVKAQQQSKKHTLRREHLRKCLDIATRQGDEAKSKDIKRRISAEHSRNTWRTINRVTRPSASRSVLQVQERTAGGITTHTTQEAVEQAIQTECDSRFHLGHSAPIARSLLGNDLQYLQKPEIAYAILSGQYPIPEELDRPTKLLLVEIGKLGRRIINGERPPDLDITGKDYVKYWRRIKENTSSSPSGLHHGHYKACTYSDTLPDLFATTMNITVRSGVHPLRWGTALQVLLEKVAGICLVDKLRSIQLYEADLNWFMKFIFNDKAMEAMNDSGLLPEEHYSQKESMAEDACLDKTLTMDISRQSRHPMAVLSLDAAQCYDRVNPIMMSLVWLALLNHLPTISILLTVLQCMKFHTRTGFGDSWSYFGGDPRRPACGLGQGSKAAPAAWIQISSMIVNAFKAEGFGANMIDPITLALTITIGCLYVDDTDIYIWDNTLTSSHSVWQKAQAAVDLWARLLMATGGAIKAEKSFWYLMDYEQKDGKWLLVRDSPHTLLVPSPSGPPVALRPRQPDDAERTLGVLHAPCGGSLDHFDKLYRQMERWVNDIKNGHLPSSMARLSYDYQLWPGLQYGLGTLSNNFDTANRCFEKLEFQLLPLLGINRHIKKGRRHLPTTFGGVGLLSLPVEQVISRTNIFLQHYSTPSSLGKKIDMTLHWLQLQLGHSGNPLRLDYDTWGHLATDSWIKALWESLHLFPIQLEMNYDDIPLPREADLTIMSMLRPVTANNTEMARINRCRCYLNLLFLSDITSADGTHLDDDLITGHQQPLKSKMKFPREEPSKLDWNCWTSASKQATLPGWKLHAPLGKWAHTSHIPWRWFWSPTHQCIYEQQKSHVRKFTVSNRGLRTRNNQIALPTSTLLPELPPGSLPISVKTISTILHDYAVKMIGEPGPPTLNATSNTTSDIWDILRSWGGNWMWSNLHFDKRGTDMDWLVSAMSSGTALWVTDGSFDIHRSPTISGAGWIVLDTESNRHFACSFAEYSSLAGSYRAELLGLLSIHTFLLALEKSSGGQFGPPTTISCDNLKALDKASEHRRRIPHWMKCPDILHTLRNTKKSMTSTATYQHVPAHMDDIMEWNQLTTAQQLNVQCDLLAKAAVARARECLLAGTAPSTRSLPRESATIYVNTNKLTSDPTKALRYQIGYHQARQFHIQELGWDASRFDGICWDSLHNTLSQKSGRFPLWLTKQTANFSASRKQVARCEDTDDNRCPSCVRHIEDANHLCICPNEDRTLLLKNDTDDLGAWLCEHDNTHPEIAYWIPKYILCRGSVKFASLGKMSPEMKRAAEAQDTIGWREFMEGRISVEFGRMQQLHLLTSESLLTPAVWSKLFISKLLHITHSQWILRNFMLHNSLHGYLALNDRVDILRQVESLLETREDEIPEDRRFLLELDLTDIAELDYNSQNYWVHAVTAARHSQQPAAQNHSGRHTSRSKSNRPWVSRWGISHVLEQIRSDGYSTQASSTPWWGVDPRLLLERTPPHIHAPPTTPRRNATNRRRKPD